MMTFTFRIPDSMAGRLCSAEMRSWLTGFLQNPHPLPPDPGSGYERISLTLPRELVRDLAGYLRCSPSIALRRVAAARLGVQGEPATRRPNPPIRQVRPRALRPVSQRISPGKESKQPPHDNYAATTATGEVTASAGIAILMGLLIMGGLIFFGASVNGINNSA
jgi:hypothetical protein